ncbi:MAG: TMEM175 family protein [Burkholderiales bacterium]
MLTPLPLPKGRLEALTDGIFAVTMTLLVLDLKLPDVTGASPQQAVALLRDLLPHLDDYVISFVVLCVFWLAHLRVMRRIEEVDPSFTWLNLFFLLFTTFVPPLTAFIGHNPTQPVAAVAYGCNLILILLCEALMWRRAAHHLMKDSEVGGEELWRFMRRRFGAAALVIVLGMVAALVEIELSTNVGYASYIYLLLIAAGVVRHRRDTHEGVVHPHARRAPD